MERTLEWDFAHAWDEAKSEHFARTRKHLFALRGLYYFETKAIFALSTLRQIHAVNELLEVTDKLKSWFK